MFPRQLDQIASQHVGSQRDEARQAAQAGHADAVPRRRTVRKRTGWTLVAIGLRLAESSGR